MTALSDPYWATEANEISDEVDEKEDSDGECKNEEENREAKIAREFKIPVSSPIEQQLRETVDPFHNYNFRILDQFQYQVRS